MKKFLLSLLVLVAAVSFSNAQLKVLVVDADDNGYELDGMAYDALVNSGYTIDSVLEADYVANLDADENYLSQYNVVIWFAGNDGIQPNLWDVSDTTGGHLEKAKFSKVLLEYMKNGGVLWVDGLDILYDVYSTAGDTWEEGTFVYDIMGISGYLSQSHTDVDGNIGVAYYSKATTNDINTLDQIKWTWGTLWFADGLAITPSAKALYVMGDKDPDGNDYALAGQVTALVNYNLIYSGFRFGKLVDQATADQLVKEILDAIANGDISNTASPNIDKYLTDEVTSVETANENVSVWPNPAVDYVNIAVKGKANVTVSDMAGKTVLRTVVNGKESINLNGFAKGIYNIQITTDHGIVNKKLIVK